MRTATEVLKDACAQSGLAGFDAELIRLGENALFLLPSAEIVVRIARSMDVLDDVRKEVRVATWLRNERIASADITEHVQPLVVQGHPVTFWRFIQSDNTTVGLTELGAILHILHKIPVSDDVGLPEFDIFGRVYERITTSIHLSGRDRDFLLQRFDDLRERYSRLQFPLSFSAVHGDAHNDNLIRRPNGEIVLIDFERFAFGPPESDLAVTATEYLLGWHSADDYEGFVMAYGFDVMSWEGFPVLRAINELKMTTWLMQNVDEAPSISEEFQNRLQSLRRGSSKPWKPF